MSERENDRFKVFEKKPRVQASSLGCNLRKHPTEDRFVIQLELETEDCVVFCQSIELHDQEMVVKFHAMICEMINDYFSLGHGVFIDHTKKTGEAS